MAVATQTVASFGRIAVLGNVAVVHAQIQATATPYAAASGGLAVDLTDILKQASPFSAPIHPDDVIGVIPMNMSTNGYLPIGLTKGVPTYTQLSGGSAARPRQTMATFPAFIRLTGIGAAATNGAALGQVADGNITDTIDVYIVIARGGTNTN